MYFQSAEYEYFYDLKGFPGGSSLLEFDDTVSYRKLDLGIFFAVDIFEHKLRKLYCFVNVLTDWLSSYDPIG